MVSGSLTALEGPTTSERPGSLAIIAGLMAYVGYRLMLHARVSRNPQMSGT